MKMDNAPERSLAEELQSTIDAHGIQISDVLGQARQLTTVSGLAFGFLLSIASSHVFERILGRTLVSFALMSTACAILVFLLPLLYTQLRFPMDRNQVLQFYVWRIKYCSSTCGVTSLYYADSCCSPRAYILPCGMLCISNSTGPPP